MEQKTRERGVHRRMTLRQWLAVLPWDIIYALGTILVVAILVLAASIVE
jgi:hypothetical protein